jgi:hypothetical protein
MSSTEEFTISTNKFGQHLYEGYCSFSNNKSLVSGTELPAWDDLPDDIQKHGQQQGNTR